MAEREAEVVPSIITDSVFSKSSPMPEDSREVSGYEFTRGQVDYHALLQSYRTSGFQATNFGLAVEQINEMVLLLECKECVLTAVRCSR